MTTPAIVVFKNGSTLKVPQQVVVAMHERIVNQGGARKWQGFTNEDTNEILYLINLDEICYIEGGKQ